MIVHKELDLNVDELRILYECLCFRIKESKWPGLYDPEMYDKGFMQKAMELRGKIEEWAGR